MFKYIIKRILIFIPTLLIISLVAFSLSKLAPGDPVEIINQGQASDSGQMADMLSSERKYLETAERLGLNLPVFYFSMSSKAYPDTLHHIVKSADRQTLGSLIEQYGNWPQISNYYKALKSLQVSSYKIPNLDGNYSGKRKVRTSINDLYLNHKDGKISRLLNNINEAVSADTTNTLVALSGPAAATREAFNNIKANPSTSLKYIPDFKFYGTNNQYHRWITNFFKGDFGVSYLDNRPVGDKIWDALRWTLIMQIISIILAYLISIPLGVTTAVKKDGLYDRITTTLLFILYSLPSFWIGTILIVFFTTSDYGAWTNLFPPGGLTDLPKEAPFFQRFMDIGYHLILPVFCITYGSLAYISRQMRGGMLSVISQDYIRTAKAKGLDQKGIIWKHAFRNSLFPIITMFAYIFPAAIAGSIAIEVIYSIPGMGGLAYSSIVARDWPVVFTILMFAAILTMIGNLVADMLYAWVDPRVTFE